MKRTREDASQRESNLPPIEPAMQGDSVLNVAMDFTYQTLQGLSSYPAGIGGVQYEVVAQIPRQQGIDVRVFAMFEGSGSIIGTIGIGNEKIVVTLQGSWQTMVQTSRQNVTPVVALDQCALVFNAVTTVAADNVSNANQQIVIGAMRSGIVQDFTGDLLSKIESTTVQTKCKLIENCLSRAMIKQQVATRKSVARTFLVGDIVSQQIVWNPGNSIAIVAKWAAGCCQFETGATWGTVNQVSLKQEIPYGVLPFFWFGDTTLQIIHVVLKWVSSSSGLSIAYMLQPFESMGCMPPRGTEGTWIASLVVDCRSKSVITMAGLLNTNGFMRMYCPTSIPTIAFTGLSNNVIYMNGSAFATAPPANPIPESYGGHPSQIENCQAFFDRVQATIDVKSNKENIVSFY